MPDSKFFKNAGPFSLDELAEVGNSKIHAGSDGNISIKDVSALDKAEKNDISFLDNPKYISDFSNTRASACIINEKFIDKAPEAVSLLISENPYHSYALIASHFYPANISSEIASTAAIHKTAKIGKNCFIGENITIGPSVEIGNNCIINPSVSISHAIIGDNVILHHGVCIGQDGFGYAISNGVHVKVPQLGRVIIENDVEIGANTCIDRGSGPDTIIGEGTKIDNLVQIGHNVQLGKGCIVVSQTGISGSATVGNYSVLGGQVGVAGHLKIGNNVQIAAKSGVIRDINDGEVVGGFPSIPIKQWHRQTIELENLTKGKK